MIVGQYHSYTVYIITHTVPADNTIHYCQTEQRGKKVPPKQSIHLIIQVHFRRRGGDHKNPSPGIFFRCA